MQKCFKCDIISRIKEDKSDVYISASESYLLHKLKNILTTHSQPFIDIIDVICVKDVHFLYLINLLFSDSSLTDMEKQQIQLLPLQSGEKFNPQHLFSFRTLFAWHELNSSCDLLEVIGNRRIITYFHPIFYSKDKEIFAFEFLSRGFTEDGKLIPPLELFHKAKVLDLQFALDRVTREVSIENAAKNKITEHNIFINFLPTAIYNPRECLQTTIKAAENFNINPTNLVFEVVESEQVKDVSHLKSILDYYKGKGYQCALDDFGSGYSSLKLLDILSPDYVKIDMHFIRDIDKESFKQSVLKAVIDLAQNKGIKTIAEGIETQQEHETVKQFGVDFVQGYYFAKPSPNITEWHT